VREGGRDFVAKPLRWKSKSREDHREREEKEEEEERAGRFAAVGGEEPREKMSNWGSAEGGGPRRLPSRWLVAGLGWKKIDVLCGRLLLCLPRTT